MPASSRNQREPATAGSVTPIAKPWAAAWQAVVEQLEVELASGLTSQDVPRQRARYGRNRLKEHVPESSWRILLNQLMSLMIALLAAAAAIAFVFGETLEGWAVVVVIVLNTTIGFITELRAVRSMDALYTLANVTARVRRDGRLQQIPAHELVVGDIVLLEGGDLVTADLRIVEASKLQADEAALTGESMPVSKRIDAVPADAHLAERASMLYKGTSITRGTGVGIVIATGMQTELGTISALVAAADDTETPLEIRLEQLGRRLIWVTLGVTMLITVSGTLAGRDLMLMIQTGLALAVAAIPEGLPIVATVALARGLQRMARRKALIKRLASVETLGATGIICTDKTGTLTENRLSLTRIALHEGIVELQGGDGPGFAMHGQPIDALELSTLRSLLETGVLCNNASLGPEDSHPLENAVGDPLETALLAAGAAAGLEHDRLLASFPERREEAFDPDVKMMGTVHVSNGDFRVAIKGAPEEVLAASDSLLTADGTVAMGEPERSAWLAQNEALAADGLRVIALASRKADSVEGDLYAGLTFIGLAGFVDPPRREIRGAIEECRDAGIRVVMITGDQAVTAALVAREIGLGEGGNEPVILGSEIRQPQELSETEAARLLQTRLFARVSPAQKLQLIELYQQAGYIVAMTGDGVNDAPALKKADIGIAMGQRGTQVAQESSDMVLQDDAFQTIVAAVREGRAIFANIRTFVLYLMSCNVGEVMLVGLASLLGTTLPILPLQILFLNLVTDVFPALAVGIGPGEDDLMQRQPRDPQKAILGQPEWWRIGYYAVVFTAAVLGALVLAEQWLGMPPSDAVTVSFLTLAFAQLWHVFNMRDPHAPLLHNEITRNPFVWAALLVCVGLILLAVNVPTIADVLGIRAIGVAGWLLTLCSSFVPLLAGQCLKAWQKRRDVTAASVAASRPSSNKGPNARR